MSNICSLREYAILGCLSMSMHWKNYRGSLYMIVKIADRLTFGVPFAKTNSTTQKNAKFM